MGKPLQDADTLAEIKEMCEEVLDLLRSTQKAELKQSTHDKKEAVSEASKDAAHKKGK